MLRDVFYYGKKPNAHPREKFAKNLEEARRLSTTDHFWIINEFCDYKNFEWDFDFDFLPDEDVWAEDHNNVWPSVYQKDSGTWLCNKNYSETIIYRNDVPPLKRKNIKTDNWIIHEDIDLSKFDYSWHPDPTDPPYIYVWGNQYVPGIFKPTLEYKVEGANVKKYMPEIIPVLPQWDRWRILYNIDKSSFDFSWRPDPLEPPLIYVWGNDQHVGNIMPTIEYVMEGATERKYMNNCRPKLLPDKSRFEHLENSDGIDYSFYPDPTSPPYIYAWGNQWNTPEDKVSIQLVVPGAKEYRYMEQRAVRKPCMDNWIIPDNVDVSNFDFSWEPSPAEPPYIYYFGTQWQKTGGPRYVVPGATEAKYVEMQKVKALPTKNNWTIPSNVDISGFDFSWHPDDLSPPYIYVFSTQWALTGGPVYTVEGATEKKYVEYPTAVALPDKTNWIIPNNIDITDFDFSWHPFAEDDPCIYQIGTQHQKTGGPKYVVPGTDVDSPIKYVDTRIIKSKILPDKSKFVILHPIIEENFDWSWHPDETEEPYIYVFGNQHYSAEKMPTVEYHVEGATQYKYINKLKAELAPNKDNWVVKIDMAESIWDFTWVPDPGEPPYIYIWGNQWNDSEVESTIEYHMPGATEKKYMNNVKAHVLPDMSKWKLNYLVDKKKFDFTWRPDPGSPPYIYVFGSNLYPAEEMSAVEYHVDGATDYKYMSNMVATLLPDKRKWVIPNNVDVGNFDFSWHPNPKDPPYIYYAGTQWQKSGGPKYVVECATEIKYLEGKKVKALPNKDSWILPSNIDVKDFDFSWHPDDTDPPYIYQFGTQWALSGGPRYVVEGATEIKYMDNPIAVALPDKTNWEVPKNIDSKNFDYSWHPYVEDQPYIYQFGTQWQKTGGPRYITPGANEMSPIKYIDRRILKSKRLPDRTNWEIPNNIDTASVDYTWHPDDTETPYIYEFGTQWHDRGGPRYVVPGATAMKYSNDIKGKLLPEKINWEILTPIVEESFDFSWHPHPDDPPFIYVFGNNLYPAEEMETVRYVVPGATQKKYVNDIVAQLASDKTNWVIPDNVDTTNFDFTWKPHPLAPPYIYDFGTQWQKTGGPMYVVPGAIEKNYVKGSKAIYKPKERSNNWIIPDDLELVDDDFFSWHPDATEKPYIYQFGTQWALTGGPKYVVPGATETKFMDYPLAKAAQTTKHWIIPDDIDKSSFDFSWHPYGDDQPYIYQFGTQWQKTGGPQYIAPGCDEMSATKYIDTRILKARKLPRKNSFTIEEGLQIAEFDYSWHPDETEEPYIYIFGNDQYSAEIMPTIRYIVPGAKKLKYISNVVAKLKPNKNNYKILQPIDESKFDFTWIPNPHDPPYIYTWGNKYEPVTMVATVEYHVPGATERKYMDQLVEVLPQWDRWKIKEGITVKDFDFNWRPDPREPAYIYVWGNQWNSAEVEPTITYNTPGATEYKYVQDRVIINPDKSKFIILHDIKEGSFDFSWRPNPYDPPYIYVFGNDQYSAEVMPTIEYHVHGATEHKYISTLVAKLNVDMTNWREIIPIDKKKFDFSWRPDPNAPPYIYVFGNQWNDSTIEPTIEYRVPGATDYKYVKDIVATVLPDKKKFKVLRDIEEDKFDFSWRPNPYAPPYIYVFGNQHYPPEKMPTVQYRVDDASEKKYVHDIKATLSQNYNNFKQILPVDINSFDFSWLPDPDSPPYIYVFGNQWNDATIEPTLEYHVTDAVEKKYMTQTAKVLPDKTKFKTLIEVEDFDFSWRPNPKDPAYIYVFGNQWHKAEVEPSIEYKVEGAIDRKYINDVIAVAAADMKLWQIDDKINVDDFDFTWRPDPGSPPYIYQFGTLTDDTDGPRYVHPNNTGEIVRLTRVYKKVSKKTETIQKYYIETTLEELAKEHSEELFWAIRKDIDYTNFNFDWRPNIEQARYVHVFGSPESEITQTYFVSGPMYKQGYRDFNYIEGQKKLETDYLATLFKQSDMFFVDRGNPEVSARFAELKAKFPNIQKTRFLNSWVDTVNRCINRANTSLCWILNSELDYSNFDFNYYPNEWQMKMVHVFGTQWSHWGTTFMINRETFPEDTKWIKIIEHLNNLNFVKERRAIATNNLYDIVLIDHGNSNTKDVLSVLEYKAQGKSVKVVPYSNSYLETIKNIVNDIGAKKEHYLWICSSVCDYTSFDFSYICDPFAKDHLHVFPSDRQKFGDTFLIDVNKTKEIIESMNSLTEYHKVNYNQHQRPKRLPAPTIISHGDTHVNSVKKDFDFPYAVFITDDNRDIKVVDTEPMSLWDLESKEIIKTTTGGTRIIVPKEAKDYVKTQLYDYPYIKTTSKIVDSQPLDIVYLSNGEKEAEQNYDHLVEITKGLKNRVVRVENVQGRVAAYHAASKASNTPWAFTVFAKLKVNPKFDFNWQPDRLQQPKHYIFHAKNPVNGLEYGHQGIIAYNKQLVFNNFGEGLDFTLDDPHETIELLSGTANFNTDAYSTWRTAFREVIKLQSDYTDISKERLNIWLTKAKGKFAKDCLQGSKDAVEYYQTVNGDIDQLKLSYEWDWLKQYYNRKYK